ncbi:hypothetical protein COHA_005824 [Chlorella ohadii]|uniref:Ubiquitin-like domain-containing protein n=1 Tax=Chlorella ohadii TaxID=2649997 RepID=A0AAD5DR78_9CHLO|nr:hypothetical protein COHA_005824 [Chlorella ohadii]
MVAATLDGQACSLELPADCISLAQVASYAKRDLGAAWADACVLPSSEPYLQRLQCVTHFDGKTLSGLQNNIGGPRASKKRLFLSANGWQPGGAVAEDAGLLAFTDNPQAAAPTADELPASLLRGGLLQLRAFSAQRAQARRMSTSAKFAVTIDLPDGRCIELPVTEAVCGADVANHVAALLGCDPAALLLWPRGGSEPLGSAEKAMPGTHFRARLRAKPGPGVAALSIKTLTGKLIPVHLAPDSTVAELKHAIEEEDGITVDQQRIIWAGKQLDNDRTLADYNIADGAELHLVLRLRGGQYFLSSGPAGNFEELGLAAGEQEVAAVAAAGRIPLEVVLPDGRCVLLSCGERDGSSEVLAALRKRLAAADAGAAALAADVDELQDVAAMREQLRQAQLALCERWRHAQA